MYRFLASDLTALEGRLGEHEERLQAARSGIHASTTQSSETWHDNPMFDEVQQQAKMWDAERRRLTEIRNNSVVVEPSAPDGRAEVGSTVRVRNVATGAEAAFTIGSYMVVGADPDRISYSSPLGRILLGAARGDVVRGSVGARTLTFEVLEVSLRPE